ncbi:hypothetical protein LCGC14_2248860, partial [marine sediment metagenome]
MPNKCKKVRYSGTIKVQTGDFMVYMTDGTVKTYREVFAGPATGNNKIDQNEIEFYIPLAEVLS